MGLGLGLLLVGCGAEERPPTAAREVAAPTVEAPNPAIARYLTEIKSKQRCNRLMGCKPGLALVQQGRDAVPAVLGLVDGGFNPSFVCGVRSEELLGQRRQITLPINQVRESRDRRCQALDVAIEFFAGRRRSTALPRLARSAQDLGKFSKIL